MKSILFSWLLFSFTALLAQSECRIYKHYGDFLKAEKITHGDQEFVHKSVVKVKTESCVEKLANNNMPHISYLLTHFINHEKYADLVSIEDSVELQAQFIQILRNDSFFNDLMSDFADKTINKKANKDSVSIDFLINIAVKYFAILSINDEGNFLTRICTGFNLIDETEPERNPHIEAFAFSSIMKNLTNEDYNLYGDFVSFVKNIYTLNLGTEKNEKLLRAQGAIFMTMRENSKLKDMLINEYEKKQAYLPFKLHY